MYKSVAAMLAALFAAAAEPAFAADWHEARSKHFTIVSKDTPKRVRAFAEKLERFDQAVRYVRGMEDPALTDAGRVKIFVLPNERSMIELTGLGHARGMYVSSASGAYAFVTDAPSIQMVQGSSVGVETVRGLLGTTQIFFHEYAHHLQLQDNSLAVPAWFREGFAEFFATAEIERDGSVTIGKFPQYRSWAVFAQRGLPLEQIVGGTYTRLTGEEMERLYGRGWLLTHYLTLDPSRRGQLRKYLDAIQEGVTPLDAGRAAFGDIKALDKALDAYIAPRKLMGFTVSAKVIPIGEIAVRPLRKAEEAALGVHMRSKRGVDAARAAAVVADARRVAAAYPGDAMVLASLAEAEFDAGNNAAAEAAADRALAADPKTAAALIYKGKAQMRLASGKASANWDGIRSWFTRANTLDTENAEPLALYYQTYGAAGREPTRNAIDALLYAADLAPQDDSIRAMATHQLIVGNRLAEARTMFAPLAYHPHLPENWRARNRMIMDALTAGNGSAAVTLMSTPPPGVSMPNNPDGGRPAGT